jgi:guanyl-specific ribonuclease Sa
MFFDANGNQEVPTYEVPKRKITFSDLVREVRFRLGPRSEMPSMVFIESDQAPPTVTEEDVETALLVASSFAEVARDMLPEDFSRALDEVETGADRPNVRNPHEFKNNGKGGTQVLPTHDHEGNPITYTEHTVNPREPGKPLDRKRIVTGSDGSVYCTDNHYETFRKVVEITEEEGE